MLEAVVTMSLVLKNFDFEWRIAPEDVGMKTGATIHTMNGLMMTPRPIDESASSSVSSELDGWWVKQHLKRGLSADGRPFVKESDKTTPREGYDVASGLEPESPKVSGRGKGKGGCPVGH